MKISLKFGTLPNRWMKEKTSESLIEQNMSRFQNWCWQRFLTRVSMFKSK